MADLGEQIFNLPVRVGSPRDLGGLTDVVNSPVFATGVGLVKYGGKNIERAKQGFSNTENVFSKIMLRMKDWFGDFF